MDGVDLKIDNESDSGWRKFHPSHCQDGVRMLSKTDIESKTQRVREHLRFRESMVDSPLETREMLRLWCFSAGRGRDCW